MLKAEESRRAHGGVVRVHLGCNVHRIRSRRGGGPSVCHGSSFQWPHSKGRRVRRNVARPSSSSRSPDRLSIRPM